MAVSQLIPYPLLFPKRRGCKNYLEGPSIPKRGTHRYAEASEASSDAFPQNGGIRG